MPLPATIPLPGGLALPAVGFGTYRLRGQEAFDAVSWALAAGVRHIDTASAYRNEQEVAAALAASGVPRSEVFLTTKVGPKQQGTERATAATEASLATLGEPLDAILIHWPGAAGEDAASPAATELRRETWRVLEGLHRAGRVRAIGVSNYEPRHLEELMSHAEVKPAINQVECHPRWQQRALRALCAEHGIAVVAYASLGEGALIDDPTVAAVAAAEGVTPAQALLLWGLQRGCAVIPKSAQRARTEAAAPAALLGLQLSEASLAALDGMEEEQGAEKYCWDPSGIA